MSYEQNKIHTTYGASQNIDAGLQSYMRSVYNTMSLGLALTGLTAFAVANIPALFNTLMTGPMSFVFALAPLGVLMFGFTPKRLATLPIEKLTLAFSLFSVLMGVSLSYILHSFTGESVARVFFITAATFSAVSLYGYTTKRDLAGVGSFMFMGLIGVVVASLVNLFVQSSMLQFIVSVLGVFIFTGLAAWNTQNLKLVYRAGAQDANARMALAGALNLYMDFINLFMSLIHLLGERK